METSSDTTDPLDLIDIGLCWRQQDLADMLRHQLASPLLFDLARYPNTNTGLLNEWIQRIGGPDSRFSDLFQHAAPPLELLQLTKDFAKSAQARTDCPLPREVALAIYYAAIATALLHYDRFISTMSRQQVIEGFEWLSRQGWLDAEIRRVISNALTRLTHPASATDAACCPGNRSKRTFHPG